MELKLTHTPDGGEIEIINGQLVLSDGIDESVYLSLFGGAEEDSGLQNTESLQWWGNLLDEDPARKYRSETQFLLRSLPATTGNLQLVDDAIGRDLAWMIDSGVAQQITKTLRMTSPKRIEITISLTIDGRQLPRMTFSREWGTSQ